MAKLEEITTFNLDDKTYAVADLSPDARDLLSVYLATETDIVRIKTELVKSQHALSSMGNMFREMIKNVTPMGTLETAEKDVPPAPKSNPAFPVPKAVPKAPPKRKAPVRG